MQTLKILIVEDELTVAMEIESCLQDLGYTVCGVARNDEVARALVDEHEPDLIIMDIDLGKESVDGIELSQQLKKTHHLPIVYLTNLYKDKDIVKRAIKSDPQGFLMKPQDINTNKLSIAIEMVLMKYHAPGEESENLLLVEETSSKSFFIKQRKSILKIDFDDIVYFESNGESVYIYTEHERLFFTLGMGPTLKKLKRTNFIRIHRSYAINGDKIHSYISNDKEKKVYINFKEEQKAIPLGETFKQNLTSYFPRLTSLK